MAAPSVLYLLVFLFETGLALDRDIDGEVDLRVVFGGGRQVRSEDCFLWDDKQLSRVK
jgi:hypothetical protein